MKRIFQGLLLAAALAVGETDSSSSVPSEKATIVSLQTAIKEEQTFIVNNSSVQDGSLSSASPLPTKMESKSTTKDVTTPEKKPTKTVVSSSASASLRRIKKEYKDAVQMGICYDWVKGRLITSASTKREGSECQLICLGPLATNLRHWHFSFRGVKNSLYESGIYHGRILLPKDYPATPPRVQLWTPSGRFQPLTDICLSASAYHPESWTPRWTVLSLVHALRLHMLTNPQEIGGIMTNAEDTLEYARRSLTWKVSWVTGNHRVTVDHSKLLEQKALAIYLDEEEDEEPPSTNIVDLGANSSEVSVDVEDDQMEETKDESIPSMSAGAGGSGEHQHATEAVETLERAKTRAKLKKSTKKKEKAKNLKSLGLEVRKRKRKRLLQGALFLTMTSIFAMPLRARLFLVFLAWLL
jgi:ubiquitin-protein ligase